MKTLVWLLIITFILPTGCPAQVPSANPPKRSTGDGLRGYYYNGYAFNQPVRSQVDPTINFFYDGHKPPVSGVRPQLFSVRWTGQLLAPESGYYQFSSIADDGVRIWVGGVKVMEEWRDRGRKLFSQPALLKAGQFYAIRVEYVNYYNGGFVDLDWELPRKAKYAAIGFITNRTIIPTAYLFSDPIDIPRIPPPPMVVRKPPVPVNRPPVVLVKKAAPKLVVRDQPTLSVYNEPKPVLPVAVPVNPFDKLATTGKQTLNHVSFRQSSYVLLPESYEELNQFADALKRFPDLRVDIIGHTDNVGDPRLNQTLSEYRAKMVGTYLIRQGIDERRINAIGYGGTRPLASNDSEENRARNRRVEIRVLTVR